MASTISRNCKRRGYVWWQKVKNSATFLPENPPNATLLTVMFAQLRILTKQKYLLTIFAEQCSQPPDQHTKLPSMAPTAPSPEPFTFAHVSSKEVYEDLQDLSPHKSTSDNAIIPILRDIADLVCVSLGYLFNLSLSTSTFPSVWKMTTVVARYKNRASNSCP